MNEAERRMPLTFGNPQFWREENLRYSEPYFRLEKCAAIVNQIAQGKTCNLLDVGCGPATLAQLLNEKISYFGIDIAIHNPSPNLLEKDITKHEISFNDQKFDIVVCGGVFEYLGELQSKKLSEIRRALREDGRFVVTYTNFHHIRHSLSFQKSVDASSYSNMQSISAFKKALKREFRIERSFPCCHNWHVTEPRRKWLKRIQMPLRVGFPLFSRFLAVNYFFICSPKR